MKNNNNHAALIGKVLACKEIKQGKHIIMLETVRLSNNTDVTPVLVKEPFKVGQYLSVQGRYTSIYKDKKLFFYVSAREIKTIANNEAMACTNEIYLDGYILKPPVYRKTPLGREITELLIVVNRPNEKEADYIPCICWGRIALFCGGLEIGDRVQIDGRIQSREYTKKISETESEKRIAYEVSAWKVALIREKKKAKVG